VQSPSGFRPSYGVIPIWPDLTRLTATWYPSSEKVVKDHNYTTNNMWPGMKSPPLDVTILAMTE
jgi:hypothetical protein